MALRKPRSRTTPERFTVNLAEYPDLVIIYLGMRAGSLRGVKTLASFGPKIRKAVADQPEGLLLHESVLFSLIPPHVGMRQYWRDFESLERWARTGVHSEWWQNFLRDRGGTGFWHETYFRDGRIESVYIDMPRFGLGKVGSIEPARGSLFSARRRLRITSGAPPESAIPEDELYRT